RSTAIGSVAASARAVTCAATSSSVGCPSRRPSVNANPELVLASALKPSASRARADPASHGFGITNGAPSWRARNASAFALWFAMFLQPCSCEALLCAGEPCFRDEVAELTEIEAGQVGDPHQHGWIAVEVRRREVEASRVGEH